MLREIMKDESSEIGKKIKESMNQGLLVPDEIIFEILKNKIESQEVKEKGYLLGKIKKNKKKMGFQGKKIKIKKGKKNKK
jgi:adenylate kinase family enzyme